MSVRIAHLGKKVIPGEVECALSPQMKKTNCYFWLLWGIFGRGLDESAFFSLHHYSYCFEKLQSPNVFYYNSDFHTLKTT